MNIHIDEIIPKIVYKYRRHDSAEEKRIITHQEIYFAKPSDFLDPYDCKYLIDRDYVKDEMNRRKYYAKSLGLSDLFHPDINHLLESYPISDKLIDSLEIQRQRIIDSIYGVFSVSETYRNDHLWELFGAKNKGFCVGLDFRGIFPLDKIIAGKVKYAEVENLPKSRVFEDNIPESITYFFDLFLTLKNTFHNECEYRIIKSVYDIEERKMKVNKSNIKSIILGYKMTKLQREEIIDLTRTYLPNTSIKRLTYNNGNIKEIAIQ